MRKRSSKVKEEVIPELIDVGADISGGIAGAVLGSLVAGPAGFIIGGASGPILTKVFKVLGKEVKQRQISPREEIRIGAAYAFAIYKLQEKLQNGFQLRTDQFFTPSDNERASSEEILEGVILGAQKEYEERKVKHLGYLYANICTNPQISKEQANQLIKTINILSYRQLCILQLFKKAKRYSIDFEKLKNEEGKDKANLNRIKQHDIMIDIRDIQNRGLLGIVWRLADVSDNSRPIPTEDIMITESGLLLCDMLSLNEIQEIELIELNNLINLI